jgi:hypothetical protein
MAFSTTALVSGLSQVLAARNRGDIAGTERRREITAQEEDRARKAQLEALQARLLAAHAGYYDRSRGAGAPGRPTVAQSQAEAHRRVADVRAQQSRTAADITAARKAVPQRPALGFETPADSSAFVADSSGKAQQVADLQARADSLRQVGDSLTAAAGGRTVPRHVSSAQQQAAQARLARLQQQFQNAITQGADPVKAKAIYDRESQSITAGP